MAEAKNTFLQGKMNKDLDDRIIPNGEYRDALNIAVGKSESHNVGSLQNVLGNELLVKPSSSGTVPFETNTNLVCIGYFVDNENNRVFQFLTSYVDPNPSMNNLPTGQSAKMKITVYDPSNNGNPYLTLVEGQFLNFSTTNLITGVNLIENLLFWTDNRNQPRKINVNTAILNPVESGNPYYVNREQITVAKYSPFIAPDLYTVSDETPITFDNCIIGDGGFTTITILNTEIADKNIEVGDQLISLSNYISQADCVVVTSIIKGLISSIVYITGSWPDITGSVQFYKCTMNTTDIYNNTNGNDNFLRDKFVRFSYRFIFDDNEISLMAPFTQPIFIPNQKGYFINGDEDASYRSTILDWMENSINQVNILISLPDIGNNIATSYKIKSMDILYKESDSLAVKVVENISVAGMQQVSQDTNIYTYKYQSQKPKKTLQEAETLRVYDKIPIRALSQEISGNRVIYGNFLNQNTPPSNLNYSVGTVEKGDPYTPFVSWAEYPNHTLKQNRTYQVGVVLADKFGRQSSVILSQIEPEFSDGTLIYGASSIFFPYKNAFIDSNVKAWYGDQLVLRFNEQINSLKNPGLGTPGLYATISGIIDNSNLGFEIIDFIDEGNNTYKFELAGTVGAQANYPVPHKYLRGKYKDYVEVLTLDDSANPIEITTEGPINDIYAYNPLNTPDIKYSYSLNELGWYSYKVVVKQQEQDYYNVYIPGILAGYPDFQTEAAIAGAGTIYNSKFPVGEESVTAHFVSINDNINKVPRDLSEVGPNQKQYRSSARLWGRVENYLVYTDEESSTYTTNIQYYPGNQPDIVNAIAPATELNILPYSVNNLNGTAKNNFYQIETSPLINRVSTVKKIGVEASATTTPNLLWQQMTPILAVYETDPFRSTLDIFWETSTSGYISDLNADILTLAGESIVGFSSLGFDYKENQQYYGINNNIISPTNTGEPDSPWITDLFYFTDAFGLPVLDITNIIFTVKNRNNPSQDVTSAFELVQNTNVGPENLYWRIKIKQSDIYFGTNSDTYGSFIFTFNITHTVGGVTYNPTITTDPAILKITNIIPRIQKPDPFFDNIFYLTSDPLVGTVVDVVGENGNYATFSLSIPLIDLYWTKIEVTGGSNPEPNFYSSFFSINNLTGDIDLTDKEIPAGTYTVKEKLQDATYSTGIASYGSLDTDISIRFLVPNIKNGCGEWVSYVQANYTPGIINPTSWDGNLEGKINIWKMLRKGEQITGSTVKANLWKPVGASGVPAIPFAPIQPNGYSVNVDFLDPTATTIGDGFFNCRLYSGRTDPSIAVAAVEVQFQGYIYTNLGRTLFVSFISDGVVSNPDPGAQVVQADYCLYDTQPGHPVAYIPTSCTNWNIENTYTKPVPWSGLHGNGKSIIGGVLQPNEQVGTPEFSGTQPIAREYSLQSAGSWDEVSQTVVEGGIIEYGSSDVCPV